MIGARWMNTKLLDPAVAFLRTLNAAYFWIERTEIIFVGLSYVGVRMIQRWERYAYFGGFFLLVRLLIETRTAWDEIRWGCIRWKNIMQHGPARSKF